jgi:mono/diheme cytochrome c family protein
MVRQSSLAHRHAQVVLDGRLLSSPSAFALFGFRWAAASSWGFTALLCPASRRKHERRALRLRHSELVLMDGPVSRWRTVLVTVIVAYGVLILGGGVFIYSGAYDIAADAPHWGLIYQVFETARIRSIKAHVAGLTPPAGIEDEARILTGTDHFADHCAVCHGAPGVPKGDIANGLYPQPPDLAVTSKRYTDAELFWIVKHGIKMTGMPAWGDHSDDELWATVAFVRKLPGMTEQDYAKLVAASRAQGGHHHETHEAQPQPGTAQPAGRADHDHSADHRH